MLRHQLRHAVVQALNDSNVPYCLLGGADHNPEFSDGDMDFAIRPCDYHAVPRILASAAAAVGARLVQAIEHETTATYFAIAAQQGETVAYIHPDCTTDYRRQGRLWMSSEELLRDRWRAADGGFRPAPDVDFKYYLTKQVLKQTLTQKQWSKLVALHQASLRPRDALSCWQRITAAQIERALQRDDRFTFAQLIPGLRYEVNRLPRPERIFRRMASLAGNGARVLRRVARPTGLTLQLTNGSAEQRTRLACALTKALAPAFRRTCVLDSWSALKVRRAVIESTLLVSPGHLKPLHPLHGLQIDCQPGQSPSANLDCAIDSVLSYLSRRTMRRFSLPLAELQAVELNAIANTATF